MILKLFLCLTLILLRWTKGWAPASASKWRMGFNSASKGLIKLSTIKVRGLMEVYPHSLFTCVLEGMRSQVNASAVLFPKEGSRCPLNWRMGELQM